MDFGHLFFSADGRIGQRDFWLGAVLLLLIGLVIHIVPIIGTLVWFYCWICLYSKRLHDMGRSGWVQLVPWIVGLFLIVFGLAVGISAVFGTIFSGMPHFLVVGLFGWVAAMLGVFALSWVAHLLFILWLGLTPGQRGPNRFGPEPAGRAYAY